MKDTMDIIFHFITKDTDIWIQGMQKRLPGANIRIWQPGDTAHADYAMAWNPPPEMLKGRTSLKGIFNLGAGVDSILKALADNPDLFPASVPLFRLEDAGMAAQMREYATYMVLGWYRRFGEYREEQAKKNWARLSIPAARDFTVGVLGAGVLGGSVAESLVPWGFPLRCWSRSPKTIAGVKSYAGAEGLDAFLAGTRVLINLLPHTPETTGILNGRLFSRLEKGAYIMNLARGAHLVENDLLAALKGGQVREAALDVFAEEPLPGGHPFWMHPRVTVTPHIAALTLPEETMDRIAAGIAARETGSMPPGRVELARGY